MYSGAILIFCLNNFFCFEWKVLSLLTNLQALQVCMIVCAWMHEYMLETVAATGTAGSNWLHNLVHSCCITPWMADSRPQTQTHKNRHLHTRLYVRILSHYADGTGNNKTSQGQTMLSVHLCDSK